MVITCVCHCLFSCEIFEKNPVYVTSMKKDMNEITSSCTMTHRYFLPSFHIDRTNFIWKRVSFRRNFFVAHTLSLIGLEKYNFHNWMRKARFHSNAKNNKEAHVIIAAWKIDTLTNQSVLIISQKLLRDMQWIFCCRKKETCFVNLQLTSSHCASSYMTLTLL
jgi:hypothetical protein